MGYYNLAYVSYKAYMAGADMSNFTMTNWVSEVTLSGAIVLNQTHVDLVNASTLANSSSAKPTDWYLTYTPQKSGD